jgi:3-hydroxy-9,10-secoandrosta-1,3,5(10)-triene-9,17-dione monooxygenase
LTSAASAIAVPLLERARALVPVLAEREAATAIARCVSDETIADFHRAGILRALQPQRFGGAQASFGVFSEIVEMLGMGCGASAWVYAVLGEHQWIIACLPERGQIDIWGDDPLAVASSSLAPRETARPATGGWRLSGRYPFSSGCLNAQWAVIGARAEDAAGNTPTRYMLVPMSQIEIEDDWHVLGLRGTGSRTLILQDVFVPEHRTVILKQLYDGNPPGVQVHPDYEVVRAPRGFLTPFSLGPVAFALAQRALAHVPPSLRARLSRGTRNMAESEFVQMQLAEASAAIELAGLVYHTRRNECIAALESGQPIPPEDVMRVRRDVTYTTHQLRHGVDMLVEISGSRAVYDSDLLGAVQRDIQTICTHAVVARHLGMVPYGRMLLGLPPTAGEA